MLPDKKGKKDSEHVPQSGTLTYYEANDVLIGNIRPYLRKIWLSDNCGGTNGDVLVIRINNMLELSPRYLYQVLASEDFFVYDNNNAKGAKMPRGDKNVVMKYTFFLPCLEKQNYIADLLEKFEKYCNDISEGLPAEIEARQKQYEYYRDKLLTFERLGE